MIDFEVVSNELKNIGIAATDRTVGIRHIGELSKESLSRVQSLFSDQSAGRSLINALSLVDASCGDAACSISQVSVETNDYIMRLKK